MKKDFIREYEKKEYYAQNREDLILEAFFPDKKAGFYVDVGGFDPDYDSVTKRFYLRGWAGINVEPQPERYERFVKKRKRDQNINCGVAGKTATMTLRVYKSGGLSTFSQSLKDDYTHHEQSEQRD